MTLHHIAIWTKNLEEMKDFYEKYFNCKAGLKYQNQAKGFSSYFLSFEGGAKLELMQRLDINEGFDSETLGLAHFAISTGSMENVDALTKRIENEGYTIKSYCRKTGDGFYESVILDPENNMIELTI